MNERETSGDRPVDPDAELVERARRSPGGDLRAFETLVRRHQTLVQTNCRHLARSADDAPDLAQEVFLKVYFGLPRFEGRSTFKSWVQRIKLNHCLNHLRKKRTRGEAVDVQDEVVQQHEALSVGPRAETNLRSLDERERIEAVLDTLPDTLRIPLLLCDLDGLEYAEIAENLGIGLSATKMRIKRGREEFRRRYRELEAAQDGITQGVGR